jgi:DNA polymerase-3 subunit gamma/tau
LPDQIMGQLGHLVSEEGIESEPAALERISRAADGSMRDGLSLLDQAIAFGGGKLADSDVAQMLGSVDHAYIARLVTALATGNGPELLALVQELAAQSRDFETVLAELAEVLHRIGLVQVVPGYTDPERADWASIEELAGSLSPEDVQLFYQIAIQGQRDLGLAPNPRTGLEMTLLRMLAFRPLQAGSAPSTGGSEQGGAGKGSASGASAAGKAAVSASGQGAEPVSGAAAVGGDVSRVARQARSAKAPAIEGGQELDWRTLLERLRLKGAVRELARNIQLDSRNGQDWHFVIPEDVKYLGSDRLVRELQSEITAQLGCPVRVALDPVKVAVSSPAVVDEQAQIRQLSDAERAIEEDPTIQSLKDRFGARILNDSIQPLQ